MIWDRWAVPARGDVRLCSSFIRDWHRCNFSVQMLSLLLPTGVNNNKLKHNRQTRPAGRTYTHTQTHSHTHTHSLTHAHRHFYTRYERTLTICQTLGLKCPHVLKGSWGSWNKRGDWSSLTMCLQKDQLFITSSRLTPDYIWHLFPIKCTTVDQSSAVIRV